MNRPGWRRANKTLYLEQPNLRVGDDFGNEAYRSKQPILGVHGADKACSGCGYLVCGCDPDVVWESERYRERLKGREPEAVTVDEADRQPEPVQFKVGDIVRALVGTPLLLKEGEYEVLAVGENRFGVTIDVMVSHPEGHSIRADYIAGCFRLVRRAGEPEPERDEARAEREPERSESPRYRHCRKASSGT